MYVDDWHDVFDVPARLEKLGEYCEDKGFDEILLYGLGSALPVGDTSKYTAHTLAISELRTNHGVNVVRAVFGTEDELNQIVNFQESGAATSKRRFDSLILEYEWWNPTPIGKPLKTFAGALTLLSQARNTGGGTGLR